MSDSKKGHEHEAHKPHETHKAPEPHKPAHEEKVTRPVPPEGKDAAETKAAKAEAKEVSKAAHEEAAAETKAKAESAKVAQAAQAAAKKEHKDVAVREEGGLLIYSANGVDMLSRVPGSGDYVCLKDFPKHGYVKGHTYSLSHEPFDEQCACTARDLAQG